MLEASIEEYVCDLAVTHGWVCRKLKWIGRRNGMDRFFLKDGRVVLIEFKRPGEKARPTQAKEIELFKKNGAEVYVFDNPFGALKVLGLEGEIGARDN